MIKQIKQLIRTLRNSILHFIGRLSVKYRKQPDFLIIGTQKGGTSSLFYTLKFHPQIKRPIKKEIHYFNTFFYKGINWYKAHFPLKSNNYITGEASPDYIYHPEAPNRIKNLYPKIKLIVLLRNPIDRAYSAFQMNKRMGIDPRSNFQDAINYEFQNKKTSTNEYDSDRNNFFYLERGLYAKQLEHWLKYFKKDQILVIKSEDFFFKRNMILKSVYTFLGIAVKFPGPLKAMNVAKYPPLPEEIAKSLNEYYKNDISLLSQKWNIEISLDEAHFNA